MGSEIEITAADGQTFVLEPVANRGSRFASQITCISEISYRSEKSSNGRKIARIAPISTIFRLIDS